MTALWVAFAVLVGSALAFCWGLAGRGRGMVAIIAFIAMCVSVIGLAGNYP